MMCLYLTSELSYSRLLGKSIQQMLNFCHWIIPLPFADETFRSSDLSEPYVRILDERIQVAVKANAIAVKHGKSSARAHLGKVAFGR